jgi:DNA-binding transcriptional LysR family regulator
MDLISGLHTFVRVVETGSFSAVARESQSSQSAVTRQIAQLEEHFDVRLFHRTTRKLSLTDEGQDLVERARRLIAEAEELEERFGRNGNEPTGLVRIGLTVGAAILLINDLTRLLRDHPGLAVELVVSDEAEDLVAERLDLALRLGESTDSSMMSRGLATFGFAAVAAPSYLEQHGAPSRPSDLLDHTCIIHDVGPGSSNWVFRSNDGPIELEVTSALRTNNALVARQAALAGYGIAMLGEPLVDQDIRAGRLYRLLPDYAVRERQAFLIYPSRKHLPQRTRLVIDFLIEQYHSLEIRLREGRAWGENDSVWLV